MKALRIVGVILIVLGLITAGYGFSYKAQAAQKEKVWEDFVSGENYNLKPLVLNVSEDKTVAGFFVFYKVSPAYWYYNGSLSIDFGEVLNRLPPTRAKPLNNPEELVRKTHIYDLIDNPENRDIFISYHITRIPDLVEIYYNDNNFIDDYGYCNGMNKDAYIVATIHGHTYFLFPEDKIGYADVIGDAKETDREYENKPFIVFYDGGLVAGYLKDPRNYDLYIQFGVPIIVADGFELPKGLYFRHWADDRDVVTFIKTRLPREVWNDIDEIVYDYLCDPSLANLYERDPSVVLRRAMFFYVEKPNTKPLRDKAKTLWGVGGILVVIGAVLLVVGGRKENG